MAKKRKVGIKLAEQKLAGARRRKSQAERDEKQALDQLAAAQRRAVKRAVSCPPHTPRTVGRKRKPKPAANKAAVSKNSKPKQNSKAKNSTKNTSGKSTGRKGGSRPKGTKPRKTKAGTLS